MAGFPSLLLYYFSYMFSYFTMYNVKCYLFFTKSHNGPDEEFCARLKIKELQLILSVSCNLELKVLRSGRTVKKFPCT